ncbi:type VII secretion protein EccCa [Actinacidiphila guanduensis]|uniref:DNA segregation ATPase FtsK/SpoIIIE, S-DNA-T family n=1 Tax=Actinacidiphila guanduensis TaxID=310781 RepID=A0A1H0SD93_9ACTN|nr:type VII secretion protein EccCa [Actinacidiphila guanduensis]SDP39724.1 DNA segregation ATPase FtsK/SpoIIIE, S-DNA-T family [Actinacidiphila guanduensis]
MSVTLFRRPPRRPGPEMPEGELQLQEPPDLPEPQGGMSGMLSYAPTALGSLSMVLVFLRPGSSGALTYVAIGMMAVSAIGMVVSQTMRASSDRKRKVQSERRDYLRYLAGVRKQVRRSIDAQRTAQAWHHPEPVALWSLVRTSRLWERRASHPDFGELRLGSGEQALALKLSPLTTKPVEDLEPLSAHALRRFIRAYGTVPDQPVAAYVRAYARVLLDGEGETVRAMIRSVLCQAAVFHAPGDLRIAVVTDADGQGAWEWVKWLPHVLHPSESDGAGPIRLVTDSAAKLETLLGADFAGRPPFDPDAAPSRDEPYFLLVLDVNSVPASSRIATDGYRNATVFDTRGALAWKAERRGLRLRVTPENVDMVTDDRQGHEATVTLGRPDVITTAAAGSLARLIAPFRLTASAESAEPLSADVELSSMLGIPDMRRHDVRQLWTRYERSAQDRLRVPLGFASDRTPLVLDIKESAEGGNGPHGLLIGATGSGKSELLRTLVLALALTHSSETLNFVLVDFKGGATFLGLDRLPHTSAVITNLADEASLVARMQDALQGELVRRQELLRSAGNHRSALDYEQARAKGADLAPLPSLLVVVDEFSELLSAHREFMDLFIMIGRLGRSLGVHLLLASQRLDEGRMGQLESHLSYRIGLRTFSAMESRGVLGVPDAYQLPSSPGNGFLRTDTATLTRFKSAYVSGPYRMRDREAEQAVAAGQIVGYTTEYVAPRLPISLPPEPVGEEADEDAPTLLAVATERICAVGSPPARQVWLPPLNVPPTLDELLPRLSRSGHGLLAEERSRVLTVPVGIVDRPFEQRRDPLVADLSGAGGHLAVAGGPQSGKSTLLRTAISALALTHSPREVQFYCLDFGGGTLAGMAGLPHVGGVTGRLDPERVGRTLIEISALISRREREFAAHGVDSMTTYRALRAAGDHDDPYGDVFLVIDGWATVRQDFPDALPLVALVAARGLNYGVHLMISANRWGELQSSVRDQLGSRFELRLGDPVDSLINMRAATGVPHIPGRGLTAERAHFLTALPRIDGSGDAATLSTGLADLVEAVSTAWPGRKAPPVRMLPLAYPASDLPAPDGDMRVPLGIEENELTPYWHDFEYAPHLVVIGDAETGKTNLLRLIGQAIARRYTPAEARVALVDFRREMYEALPEAQRLGYAVSVDVIRDIVRGAARAMESRRPGPDISPAQMRRRDWWSGPQLFLIIDDYEMVGGSSSDSPFAPLLDFLQQGTELGLHVVVARSANGAGRAMLSDPLLRRLMEVNTPAIQLSCPPAEGQIINGVKPRQFPPGRALYITRRGTLQLQTALVDDPAADPGLVTEPSGRGQ